MIKQYWGKWKQLSVKAGNFQATVVLTAFYFTAVVPFAVIFKIFADPLKIKKPHLTWENKPYIIDNIKRMKQQF